MYFIIPVHNSTEIISIFVGTNTSEMKPIWWGG